MIKHLFQLVLAPHYNHDGCY